MRTPHHLHALGVLLASAMTLGTNACNKDKDEDDDGADAESGDDEGDDTDPSAGDDADPSAGDDADPSAGDDADPSAGDDADPSAGDDAPDESSDGGSDESDGDTGSGGELNIGGSVSRSEAAVPAAGNDAIGDVYVVSFDDACGGHAAANTMVPAVDLSDTATSIPFTLEGVGPGTYFVTAFLDDNGDYDPDAPGPNKDDIVMADGVMPGCVEVEVVDADVDGAAVLLNFTLPFDPP